jgi:hypothetical protein
LRKNPKEFQGTAVTGHKLSDLLPEVLGNISRSYKDRGDIILATWPEIIGPKLAPLTQPISFQAGILTVKVKDSTLYSLLNQYDKPKLIKSLREKFPNTMIKTIVFRMG